MYLAHALTVAYSPNFSSPIAFTCMVCQNFPPPNISHVICCWGRVVNIVYVVSLVVSPSDEVRFANLAAIIEDNILYDDP